MTTDTALNKAKMAGKDAYSGFPLLHDSPFYDIKNIHQYIYIYDFTLPLHITI
jgi:hypothetical protein